MGVAGATLASNRPSRNIPRVNYNESNESSDEAEETFNSVVSDLSPPNTPLSPSNPNFHLQTSPPPIRQVLTDVASKLVTVEAIQSVVPNWRPLESEEEEVIEVNFKVAPDNDKVSNMPNDAIVNFEDEDGKDDAEAMREACRNLSRLECDLSDLKFFFKQAEIKMSAVGVKSNYTKFQVLQTIIPSKVVNEVKSLMCKDATDFPNKDAYKQLKHEILRIFGPRPEAAMERALSRTLTGLPSQLARALVNDICSKELDCSCCPAVVLALWKRHLPGTVRAGIAHCKFSKATFNNILELADAIFVSNAPTSSVAAVSGQADTLNETLPAIQYPIPEVAAANRSRGRGGRGGRGRGGGARGARGAASNTTQRRGTKHPDLPQGDQKWCSLHYRWGKAAHFCSEPATCPWKDVFTPKPPRQ